jgi:hypothetical protein
MSSPSVYTCITCHVAFHNGDLQRSHYKSDWHRYNLKRKVADLGPITAVEFAEKVEVIQQQQRAEKSNEAQQRVAQMCKDCGKAFTSENGLLNHTKSKKHLETIAKNAALEVSERETDRLSHLMNGSLRGKRRNSITNHRNRHRSKSRWKARKKSTTMRTGTIWMMERPSQVRTSFELPFDFDRSLSRRIGVGR